MLDLPEDHEKKELSLVKRIYIIQFVHSKLHDIAVAACVIDGQSLRRDFIPAGLSARFNLFAGSAALGYKVREFKR